MPARIHIHGLDGHPYGYSDLDTDPAVAALAIIETAHEDSGHRRRVERPLEVEARNDAGELLGRVRIRTRIHYEAELVPADE